VASSVTGNTGYTTVGASKAPRFCFIPLMASPQLVTLL